MNPARVLTDLGHWFQVYTMLDNCKEFNALGTFCSVQESYVRTAPQPYDVVDCEARSADGLTCNSVINSECKNISKLTDFLLFVLFETDSDMIDKQATLSRPATTRLFWVASLPLLPPTVERRTRLSLSCSLLQLRTLTQRTASGS